MASLWDAPVRGVEVRLCPPHGVDNGSPVNPPPLSLSLSTQRFHAFRKKKVYIFINNYCRFFIIKGFRTIVFIFIVISTTFRQICPPAFFRCLLNSGTFTELRTTSFIPLAITGYKCWVFLYCYSPVVRIEPATSRWLSPLKLRERTPITVMPCVLLDNSEWILGLIDLMFLID